MFFKVMFHGFLVAIIVFEVVFYFFCMFKYVLLFMGFGCFIFSRVFSRFLMVFSGFSWVLSGFSWVFSVFLFNGFLVFL